MNLEGDATILTLTFAVFALLARASCPVPDRRPSPGVVRV